MDKYSLLASFCLFTVIVGFGQSKISVPKNGSRPLKFIKRQIASESFESVDVFDVNNDKIPDIVSGAFWYEGPGYIKRHYIGPGKQFGEYWDDFSTIPLD